MDQCISFWMHTKITARLGKNVLMFILEIVIGKRSFCWYDINLRKVLIFLQNLDMENFFLCCEASFHNQRLQVLFHRFQLLSAWSFLFSFYQYIPSVNTLVVHLFFYSTHRRRFASPPYIVRNIFSYQISNILFWYLAAPQFTSVYYYRFHWGFFYTHFLSFFFSFFVILFDSVL